MTTRIRYGFGLLLISLLLVASSAYRPHAEEVDIEEASAVSETELEMYINVYKAMQSDHGLRIEDAIRPYHRSLEQFRNVERHIQAEPRLVERVRQALLEHARSTSSAASSLGSPTLGEGSATPPSVEK